jgi:electron transfer flavoprotein alpha subunit
VVEINPEPTALSLSVSDYIIKGAAGEVLPQIVEELSPDLENTK